MRAGKQYSAGPGLAGPDGSPDPSGPAASRPDEAEDRAGRRPAGRWWRAGAWVIAAIGLFAFLLRISLSYHMDSDGANSALQAWDMLHGHILLHGWIIGDATYYTFELPLYALVELFMGLHSLTIHVGSAITYLIVAICAIAVARTGSRGLSVVARTGIVIAILAAPLLASDGVSILLEKPDHTGTAAILLVCFLLIDRALGWKYTAPLIGLILCLGQIGDATVEYVAVPVIFLVCAGHALFERKLRSADSAVALAALVSVPVALGLRSLMVHLGGYLMIAPRNGLASFSRLGHNWSLTVHGIRMLYGALPVTGAPLGQIGIDFGFACLAAAGVGFLRVLVTWRTASRAEHLLCVTIVVNIAAYLFSSLPVPTNSREMVAVVPCGAILAARAFVPARITGALRAWTAVAVAGAVALVPLITAATVPPQSSAAVGLAAWLEAHGLTYGIGGYWDASAVTVESGNRVQVRAVRIRYNGVAAYDWETVGSWYNPAQHKALFVIADSVKKPTLTYISIHQFERWLGKPAAVDVVAGRYVLIYKHNVLLKVQQEQQSLPSGVQGSGS